MRPRLALVTAKRKKCKVHVGRNDLRLHDAARQIIQQCAGATELSDPD
jgi:hypothetical protein